MPAPLQKLPCFGGIGGYIDEIADLDYVVFDTPGGYLKTHAPAGEISFGQDVADGNLSGYMSWSEKPFNRLIWTRLERARAMARLAERDSASPSFETRVRLLSTTHFGLASPVMNVTREERRRNSPSGCSGRRQALPRRKELTLLDEKKTGFSAVQLALREGFCPTIGSLRLESAGLESWTAAETGRHKDGSVASIYLTARWNSPRSTTSCAFPCGATPRSAQALRAPAL